MELQSFVQMEFSNNLQYPPGTVLHKALEAWTGTKLVFLFDNLVADNNTALEVDIAPLPCMLEKTAMIILSVCSTLDRAQ
jgi:hypothetical protein